MMFWIIFSTVNRSKQLVYDLKKETRFDLEQMTETWMHDADFSTQKTAVFDYFTYPSDRERIKLPPENVYHGNQRVSCYGFLIHGGFSMLYPICEP